MSPFIAVTITSVIGAALTFGITRYRVGFDVVAVVLAAVAIDAAIAAPGRRRSPSVPASS